MRFRKELIHLTLIKRWRYRGVIKNRIIKIPNPGKERKLKLLLS
jgi:hypothetical protein